MPVFSFAQGGTLSHAWERYAPKKEDQKQGEGLRRLWEAYSARIFFGATPFPGKVVGSNASLEVFMKRSEWRYRKVCYELYFASSGNLARSVYGLALHSGDVDQTMPLERFEKGVRGFHYSLEQVCLWIDAAMAHRMTIHTDEEKNLLWWLIKDGIVNIVGGKAVPSGVVHHVLGAAPGKKRSFEETLRHERLHVLWDEDLSLAETFRIRWNNLTEADRQTAREKLAAYAQSNEAQLVEEWAVFQMESMPEQERKALVGL